MYLVIDTETTGLVHVDRAHTHSSQPRLMQLAALVLDHGLVERACMSVWLTCPRRSSSGVPGEHSTERDELCARYGVPASTALPLLHQLAARCKYLVAHNVAHDALVLELAHVQSRDLAVKLEGSLLSAMPRMCTMHASADLLELPHVNKRGATHLRSCKWPTLAEVCAHLHVPLEHAHEATCDARACAGVFRELRQRSLL